MLTIATIYKDDKEVFLEYWLPLILKYPNVEFIIMDNNSMDIPLSDIFPRLPVDNVKRFVVSEEFKKQPLLHFAVLSAKNDHVFITDIRALPTYQTMVLLEALENTTECLQPSWQHENCLNPGDICNVAYSVRKNHEAVTKIHEKGTMYYIGESK
jgi:hypothetical protein